MKKFFLLAASAVIVTSAAIAQDAPPVTTEKKEMKQSVSEWEAKFKNDLKLTDDQIAKYQALNKEYGEKIDAVLKDETLTKEVQKEKKMALKKEKEARLLEILSPEQQAKYKELKAEAEKLKAEAEKKKDTPKQQ